MLKVLATLLWTAPLLMAGRAADLARSIRETTLDPQECYRVRELSLFREDIRIYFTDGYLIFGKPVGGLRTTAIFAAETEGGDGEVLIMPPTQGERRSLASFTNMPNLDEHISEAVMLFSDDTYAELAAAIRENPSNRRMPERGVLLAETWNSVARNISESYETRLVLDLLSGAGREEGFFTATVRGRRLGNFDVSYEPRAVEQVIVGHVGSAQNHITWDTWTSFPSRSSRKSPEPHAPPFTVSEYHINATLQPDLLLQETARLKLKAGKRRLPALAFELASAMRVSGAVMGGRPAEVFTRESLRSDLIRNTGNSLFLIVPEKPLEPGEECEAEISLEGKVVFDAGNHVYFVGARSNWYPSPGLQFAIFDLTFRYPSDLDLVTPGELIEDRTEGDWHITRRRTSQPVRLAGFNLGRYSKAKVSRGGYTVEVYANRSLEEALQPRIRSPLPVQPGPWNRRNRQPTPSLPVPEPPAANPAHRLQDLASEVASALQFMASHFGPPALPTLTVSPVPGTFGQGFPGLIYLSTLSYLGKGDRPLASLEELQQLFFSDVLEAHETAHQWWGNIVIPSGYHDDWLMEALANYSALLYIEKNRGAHALEDLLQAYKNNLLLKNAAGQTVESTGPIVLGTRLLNSQEPRAWRSITYGKGSWILHMLRRRMGDERFYGMLAELRRRYERKAVSTEQFRELAAGFLPPRSPDPTLESFFDQWVYGTGIPDLKLSWSVKGKAPNLRLTGRLSQSDVNADFSAPVPVVIQFGRGRAVTHLVQSASDPVSFTVPLRQPPARVLLAPDLSVLRR